MQSREASSTFNELSKQSNGVSVWEVTEGDLKPFSNGDAAVKITLKLLESEEW